MSFWCVEISTVISEVYSTIEKQRILEVIRPSLAAVLHNSFVVFHVIVSFVTIDLTLQLTCRHAPMLDPSNQFQKGGQQPFIMLMPIRS